MHEYLVRVLNGSVRVSSGGIALKGLGERWHEGRYFETRVCWNDDKR